jgi:hypothetical protein
MRTSPSQPVRRTRAVDRRGRVAPHRLQQARHDLRRRRPGPNRRRCDRPPRPSARRCRCDRTGPLREDRDTAALLPPHHGRDSGQQRDHARRPPRAPGRRQLQPESCSRPPTLPIAASVDAASPAVQPVHQRTSVVVAGPNARATAGAARRRLRGHRRKPASIQRPVELIGTGPRSSGRAVARTEDPRRGRNSTRREADRAAPGALRRT